jgi:HPt (histidine-containing phosphotransfer) domain-containing protein/PAS domain-containing protein
MAIQATPMKWLRGRGATLLSAVLIAGIIGAVLVPGYRLAESLATSSEALQLVSEQATTPELIVRELELLRDRLDARSYVGRTVAELRRLVGSYDAALAAVRKSEAGALAEVQRADELWTQYRAALQPIVQFEAQPYLDSDRAGTLLTADGQKLVADARKAWRHARDNTPALVGLFGRASEYLRRQAADGADRLRALLFSGVIATLVLFAVTLYLQLLKSRHERAARESQEQTRDILRSVKEGFFLLDSDLRIGAVWSEALAGIFRREDFAGLTFDDLLRDLVPEKTLTTAVKYIQLLQGDRAQEKLIKGINPLAQLEVSLPTASGGVETRFLEFDFHRVAEGENVRYVLATVVDVTANVLLARELRQSQESGNEQMDLLMSMLHVDPLQLDSFIATARTGLKIVNAVLKEPSRADEEFRRKIAKIFREVHSIKGEAGMLRLGSVESRAHAFEDALQELRDRPQLSGNDFLPLVLKLDELLAHLQSLQDMATKLMGLRATIANASAHGVAPGATGTDEQTHPRTAPPGTVAATASPAPSAARAAAAAEQTQVAMLAPLALAEFADRLAERCGKRVQVVTDGLEHVPAVYQRPLGEAVVQMVRNAVVHGIEEAAEREAAEKNAIGTVRISFGQTNEGYSLTFEDDGAGLVVEKLKSAAIKRGLLNPDEAESLDPRQAFRLIFQPGFSTQDEVTKDAGRGVGMDVVAKTIRDLSGRISIATRAGHFTRFEIRLPALDAVASVA